MAAPATPVRIFVSYSHRDGELMEKLADHLSILRRQSKIAAWYDGKISAGDEWADEIGSELERASVILLLISASFLASEYCYGVELERALERHEAGEARVIPVILRPVDWSGAPFAKLQALPAGGRPITDWPNRDKAFTSVAEGIKQVIEELSDAPEHLRERLGRTNLNERGTYARQGSVETGEVAPPRIRRINTARGSSTTRRVSVRLPLLTDLQARQSELESYVRLYIELESSQRPAKTRALISSIRRSETPHEELEGRLQEIRPLAGALGALAPPEAFQPQIWTFDQRLADANTLMRQILDPLHRMDADVATSELLGSLYDVRDVSASLLDACRTTAEECLENISSLLNRIFDRIPPTEGVEQTTTQRRDVPAGYAPGIARKERESEPDLGWSVVRTREGRLAAQGPAEKEEHDG